MGESVLFTGKCIVAQQVVLFGTIFLFLVFLGFLFLEYSSYMLLLIFIDATITFFLNLFISKIYEVRIEQKNIIFKNMWKKVDYTLDEVMDIRLVHFVVPYPFNPYLKFVLKNKRGYVAIIPNRMRYYLSGGGINRYIGILKEKAIK
jgi:hypothetical protein